MPELLIRAGYPAIMAAAMAAAVYLAAVGCGY